MSTAVPSLAMTYVVRFPDEGVVKVGRAWKMSRLRSLMRAGGRVVMLLEHTPAEVERALLAVFRSRFFRAFENEADARWLLPGGRGFTECFMADADEWPAVMEAITEGLRNGYDEAAHDRRGAVAAAEVGGAGSGGEVHRDRVAGVGGRSRPGAGGAAADQGGHLSDDGVGDGRRGHRPRPAARRCRVPHAVPGRAGDVLSDRPLAAGGPTERLGHPIAACPAAREWFRNGSGAAPGSRGREQRESERARESAGRGRGLGEVLRTSSGSRRRPGPVLHRSPRRNRAALQGVRHSPSEARPLLAAPTTARLHHRALTSKERR